MKVYLSSDWHLGHGLFIKDGSRPFTSVDEMDDYIIDQVNSKVGKKDLLILLGDICWREPEEYMGRILCKNKILVMGNHDKQFSVTRLSKLFSEVRDAYTLKLPSEPEHFIYLSHYAHLVWPNQHYGSLHAFGHSHGKLKNPIPGSYDVGLDNNSMQILELYELLTILRETKNEIPNNHCD